MGRRVCDGQIDPQPTIVEELAFPIEAIFPLIVPLPITFRATHRLERRARHAVPLRRHTRN